MNNTANPVILISTGTTEGKRSRQVMQSELYARVLAQFGANAVFDSGFGNAAELAERMDALILSGGGDIQPSYYGQKNDGIDCNLEQTRDEREYALLRQFCKRKKPVFGICRGLQVIDVFFGGTLFRRFGTAYVHDTTIHSVITAEDSRLRPMLGKALSVNSYHHQAIRTLGTGLRVTAVSDIDGVIEAIEHERLPVMAVQWHPERMIRGICMDTAAEMQPLFAVFLEQIRQNRKG